MSAPATRVRKTPIRPGAGGAADSFTRRDTSDAALALPAPPGMCSTLPGVRRTALAITTLALAFPSAALAQSAGDNQYQDPFGNNQSSSSHSGSGSNSGTTSGSSTGSQSTGTSSGTAGTSTGTSTTAPTTGTSDGTTASGQTAATGQSGATLPRTGYDSLFTGVMGAVLLLGGVTVRASVRDRRR